ncbi:hypothetical protein WJX77_000331 [Trebouxia sp. C0004]
MREPLADVICKIAGRVEGALLPRMESLKSRLVGFTSILFVGHLGPAELAAAALGGSFTNVIGLGILAGLVGGMSTLCGQAYGAKNYMLVGLVYQRALLIVFLAAVPLATVLLFARPLLVLGGQTTEVAEMTSAYIRWNLPTIFGYGAFVCTTRYLVCQGIVRPQVVSSATALLLHPIVNWICIYGLGMGYVGAALASSISTWLQFLLLVVYIRFFKKGESTWPGWSCDCLKDWWPYIKLAAPCVLLASEWWALEIAIMMGGLLPDAALQLSAMAIYNSTNDLCFMVSSGMAVAVSTRVSNELGAGNPEAAQHVCNLGLSLVLAATCCLSLPILIFRHQWGSLFTSDPHLISVIGSVLVVLAFFVIFDGLSVALGGVVRGTGKQAVAAPCTVASYYLLGLPAAVALAFSLKLGVQGLCLGMLLGAAATDASFYLLMWRTDWRLEADKAAERVGVKTESGSADVSFRSLPMQEDTDSFDQQLAAEGETAQLLTGHLPISQHQHQEHV